jgi:hypothetical protein
VVQGSDQGSYTWVFNRSMRWALQHFPECSVTEYMNCIYRWHWHHWNAYPQMVGHHITLVLGVWATEPWAGLFHIPSIQAYLPVHLSSSSCLPDHMAWFLFHRLHSRQGKRDRGNSHSNFGNSWNNLRRALRRYQTPNISKSKKGCPFWIPWVLS